MMVEDVEILRAACRITGLDEQVCDKGKSALQQFIRQVGVGKASLNAMIDRARSDQNFYEQQFDIIKTDPDSTMKKLLQIAVADNDISQTERIVLAHFAQQLGMAAQRFDQLLDSAEKMMDKA